MTRRWRWWNSLEQYKIEKSVPLRRRNISGRRQKMAIFLSNPEGGRTVSFPKRMVWNQCVPTKISFFAWKLGGENDDIGSTQKMRVSFGQQVSAVWYGRREYCAPPNSLFCTWGLWTFILATKGIPWVFPYLVRVLLAGWRKISVRKEERKIWLAAPLCFF